MAEEGTHNESKLIASLRSGSVHAFDALYDMYYRRIYGYCLNFTKSQKDTEDIVQEVFIKLWLNRKSIYVDESISNYLFSIAKNKLISILRTNIGSPHYEDYIDYCETIGTEDESLLEYKEFADMVERGISKLPPMQQRIVRLSKFAYMSNKEIAHLCNITEQTVKNQLVSGLKRIRSYLDSQDACFNLIIILACGLTSST